MINPVNHTNENMGDNIIHDVNNKRGEYKKQKQGSKKRRAKRKNKKK